MILLNGFLLAGLLLWPGTVWSFSGLDREMVNDPVFGGEVAVYRGGNESGPAVVLIHGIGGDAKTAWAALVPALSKDYQLIALDLPGFGESTAGNHHYSPDKYAQVLDHLIARFVDEPVILIGHSLGGAVALRYAGRYPDRVSRLHLISVPGILHRASYSEFLASREADSGEDAEYLLPVIGRAIRKFVRRAPDADRVLDNRMLRRLVLRGEPERIAAVALLSTDFSETLDDVTAASSIYWGAADITAPLRTGKLLSARLPYGDLSVFHEAAHVPMSEDTAAFEAALLPRLERPIPGAQRIRPSLGPGDKDVSCDAESDWTLEGSYRHIRIKDCQDARLKQVAAESIEIINSRVTLIAPAIDAGEDETAIRLRNSRLSIIAGRVRGSPVIDTARSSLDLIGPRLFGTSPLLVNPESSASDVVLSVTPYEAGESTGYWHKVRALNDGESM